MALAVSLAVLAPEACLRTKMTTSGLIVVGSKEFILACLGFISRMDGVHVCNKSNNFLSN